MKTDLYFIKEAIKEAKKAFDKNEIPVGCVIVKDEKIISRGHNLTETNNQVIDHAEVIAIKKANRKLNSWRLNDCILYITLEPCSMCKEVIKRSKIQKVVFVLNSNKKPNLKYSSLKYQSNSIENEILYMMESTFKQLRGK